MMDQYKVDADNFCVIEKIDVAKVAAEVIDNRTGTDTVLLLLLVAKTGDECRDKVHDICRELGYTPMKVEMTEHWTLDLNTFGTE